ncbi:MAG: hypothetical protein H7Z43_07565, partial [Clostridia bacterium]|nr:hypothetical protein [Deltaproteobacteria bacterium]
MTASRSIIAELWNLGAITPDQLLTWDEWTTHAANVPLRLAVELGEEADEAIVDLYQFPSLRALDWNDRRGQ